MTETDWLRIPGEVWRIALADLAFSGEYTNRDSMAGRSRPSARLSRFSCIGLIQSTTVVTRIPEPKEAGKALVIAESLNPEVKRLTDSRQL